MEIEDGIQDMFGNLDNFSLNFAKAGFGTMVTDQNQGINIDYRHSQLSNILEELSVQMKEAAINEESHTQHRRRTDAFVTEMLQGEYETWDLLRCLNLADKIYFAH